MKKRVLTFIIAIALLVSITAYANTAYTDVKESDSFYVSVLFATEKGIINGMGDSAFNPRGILTVSQAIKISACIHAAHYEKDLKPYANLNHWADAYFDYAVENGIIKETDFIKADFDTAITRDRLFYIFANTLPDTEYIAINETELAPEKPMTDYVEKLFCAGIIVGNENGFELEENITRADSVLLVSRMMAYSRRQFVI